MHRRRIPIAAAVSVLVLLGITGGVMAAATQSAAPKLSGTWSGKYSGAVSGTFTLRWTQTAGRLKGTINLSTPHGQYGIGGTIARGKIKFGAVKVGATYTGSVSASGLKMSGSWASGQGGGTWSAHKLLTAPKVSLP